MSRQITQRELRNESWRSVRNRANPDPTVDVRWGDQTREEMQYTGLLYSAR